MPVRSVPSLHGGVGPLAATFFKGMDTGALRILAVDNEPSVTCSLKFIFNAPRYDLCAVENGDAALARLDSGAEHYDVIIVDQKMPHMSGLELVEQLRNRGVDSKVMVL